MKTLLTTVIAILTLQLPQAHAYYSTLNTGDTLGQDKYAMGLQPQVVLNRYDGMNLDGYFDAGINDESEIRAVVGGGVVDYDLGGYYKYIPFPDTKNQPAIGFMTGATISHVQGMSILDLRFHPLFSKHIEIEKIPFNIYGSLPFGIAISNKTKIPVQLVGGVEWRLPGNEQFSFMGEVGINVVDAFAYISFAATYHFDEQQIRRR